LLLKQFLVSTRINYILTKIQDERKIERKKKGKEEEKKKEKNS